MAADASAPALPAAARAAAPAAAHPLMSPVGTPALGSPAPCVGRGRRPVHLLGRLKPRTQRPGPCALRCRRQPVPLGA